MSANGELFITENLSDTASNAGLLNLKRESLVVKDYHYDIWREADIPEIDSIDIEDSSTGELLGTLEYRARYKHDSEGGYHETIIVEVGRGDVKKWVDVERAKGDWMIHLQPIVNDFKDGEESLTSEDVDWLMTTLRCKIEYNEGLISKEKYDTILNDFER